DGVMDIEDIYPLSPMQEGMLFHKVYAPESSEYLTQLSFTINEELDLVSLEQAWQRIAERHQILRTGFVWEELERPLQVVHRLGRVPFEVEDWREFSESEQKERLMICLEEDRKIGFDLKKAPLMRVKVLRMADQSYHLIWSHHHILLDGWSLQIVIKEVFNLYEALSERSDLALPTSPSFRSYIEWLGQQDIKQAEMFWRKWLKGFFTATPLPAS